MKDKLMFLGIPPARHRKRILALNPSSNIIPKISHHLSWGEEKRGYEQLPVGILLRSCVL